MPSFTLRESGLKTEQGLPVTSNLPIANGVYTIDLGESRVEWLGRNLINKHWGTIGLKSGELLFTEGKLTRGEFVLDMKAMHCTDLDGHELHDVLIHHLQGDDFFDVGRFSDARFIFDSAEPIPDRTPGSPNLRLHGQLTLCGETHPLAIEATAGFTDDGKPAAQASFAIDRTQWKVIYGSGKFFKRLAGHLVNDMIEMQLLVITT